MVDGPEIGPSLNDTSSVAGTRTNLVNRSRSIQKTSPDVSTVPVASGQGVASTGPLPVLSTFDGLNHRQQRLANNRNQFSLEPPDQGLCVGNGYVMETINDVTRVYDASGNALTDVTALNTFYGYAPAFVRPNGPFGPFVTDPSCLFDAATQRWYADVLTLDVFPDTGNFTGSNHLDLAVSQTADPRQGWVIYRTDVTDDGTNGTPNHNCQTGPANQPPIHPTACLGDYPHLGADANGIYITTNEYDFFGFTFHGAQVYAYSKQALAHNNLSVAVTQMDTHLSVGGVNSGFTLWPATGSGPASSSNGGTEFFLSSNAADEAHGDGSTVGPRRSNQLLVWKMTNTGSLGMKNPSTSLTYSTLPVGDYVVPARSEQKVGPTPLVDCLNQKSCATNFLLGGPDPLAPEQEMALDSNDTRMQQVVYANGMLWGALDTAVNASANTRAGIEWFVVNPAAAGGPSVVNQGYLAVSQNNVIYPAIAVRPDGSGVMAFTLVGRNYYPSAAFASISTAGVGTVQVAAAGIGPDDGFTGTGIYNAPNPARPRWGDYGAAVVDGSNIWIASEYIGQTCDLSTYLATGASCGGTRTTLANWDTRITEVTPGS
ncbi:MAG TPA: hypothetical protein VHW91_09100 [Candidatus Dormibacteraeota bacterium]|nr:hypothetical protein [Candidatus Dormibacteraeota bacterium]